MSASDAQRWPVATVMRTRFLMTMSAVLMAAAAAIGTFLPGEILR